MVGLGWDLRVCTSNKFPAVHDAAVLGLYFENHGLRPIVIHCLGWAHDPLNKIQVLLARKSEHWPAANSVYIIYQTLSQALPHKFISEVAATTIIMTIVIIIILEERKVTVGSDHVGF